MRRRELIGSLIGAAVTWPLAASAQEAAKVYRIAVVSPAVPVNEINETGSLPTYEALFGELRRLGYVEGQNLIVERYLAKDAQRITQSLPARWSANSRT
jgi:putative ABC transport system substrate-binding protein